MLSRSRMLAFLVSTGIALSGCGQENNLAPLFEPKVPSQWLPIEEVEIESAKAAWLQSSPSDAISGSMIELKMWSASTGTSAEDVFSNVSPQRVQAVLLSREIFNEELASLELEPTSIADLVIPISTKIAGDGLVVRQNEVTGTGSSFVLEQEVAWDFSGITQTLRLVAEADLESEVMTIFWVRCSDTCFADGSNQVDRVFSQILEKIK